MKKIVLLAACLFVLSVVSVTAAHETVLFEYKIEYLDGFYAVPTIQAELNRLGGFRVGAGWHLP